MSRWTPFRHAVVMGLAATALVLVACGSDDNFGSSPSSPTRVSTNDNGSSLTWEITDGCRDNKGLQIRFFDRANNLVWPSASDVYVVPSGETRVRTLSCRAGASICYGARTDPAGSTYWGVDVDGSKTCETCCTTCRTATTTRELTCN